jgi:ATP-dependent Lon protease
MSKVGVRNPLFLLDEIDKMGMDFRGDPASALLEVLDPEQNHTFVDHYVEVEYDLSDVMFVCTANTLNIPPALLDRMETIRLSGYTEDEKVHIGLQHLLPKLMKNHGDVSWSSRERGADIIRYYTREAECGRSSASFPRSAGKVVKTLVSDREERKISVSARKLNKILSVRRHTWNGGKEEPGRAGRGPRLDRGRRGAAHDRVGDHGRQGQDDHHREAGRGDAGVGAGGAVRGAQPVEGPRDPGRLLPKERHTRPPAGRRDAEGRPAGIGICTAMVSALTGIPVRADVAMTGEITLRGEVLPIGGLKEKLLAAHRGGIKTVLIPEENVKDLAEIPDNVKNRLEIHPVKWIDSVFDMALERKTEPLSEEHDVAAALPPVPGAPAPAPAAVKH